MSARPRIFVELFAGSAAVTLALIGGLSVVPPVAYMGSKRSFAGPILSALGLEPGQGADAILLCDGGPWGWVWQALVQPEEARSVAAVLRGWRDEDPVALWRRLAAEPPPAELVERAATVLWLQGRTASNTPLWWEPGLEWRMGAGNGRKSGHGPAVQRSVGRWMMAEAPGHGATESGIREKGTTRGKRAGICSTETVARRVESAAFAVAAWLTISEGAIYNKPVTASAAGWQTPGFARVTRSGVAKGFLQPPRPDLTAQDIDTLAELGWPALTVVHADVDDALALLPEDLDGVVVYMDPPYVGCTRYACECPREKVVAIARDLDQRGAVVCISEGEAIAELGWATVEISHGRRGQTWTAQKQKSEWLTMNRPPCSTGLSLQQPIFASTSSPPIRSGKHDPRLPYPRPPRSPAPSFPPALDPVAPDARPVPGLFPALEP